MKPPVHDEEWFESFLAAAIIEAGEREDAVVHAKTYDEAGVMTANRGLVVRVGGLTFQVTIVRSR